MARRDGIFVHPRDDGSVVFELRAGTVALCCLAAPERDGPAANEDAAGVLELAGRRCVLAVADGVGGAALGGRASAAAIETALATIASRFEEGVAVDDLIVPAFDAANLAVQDVGSGAATTLTLAIIDEGRLRVCNVGDSEALVTGQRGRVKFRSTSHSPVGYAVEAGLLDADEALHHADRHVISNAVGSPSMSLDVGAPLRLAPRDTLVLGSDGLFDNALADEVVELARTGPLSATSGQLVDLARERMTAPAEGMPSKPDDLTVLVFRPTR